MIQGLISLEVIRESPQDLYRIRAYISNTWRQGWAMLTMWFNLSGWPRHKWWKRHWVEFWLWHTTIDNGLSPSHLWNGCSYLLTEGIADKFRKCPWWLLNHCRAHKCQQLTLKSCTSSFQAALVWCFLKCVSAEENRAIPNNYFMKITYHPQVSALNLCLILCYHISFNPPNYQCDRSTSPNLQMEKERLSKLNICPSIAEPVYGKGEFESKFKNCCVPPTISTLEKLLGNIGRKVTFSKQMFECW